MPCLLTFQSNKFRGNDDLSVLLNYFFSFAEPVQLECWHACSLTAHLVSRTFRLVHREMALLLLYFFLVFGALYSCNAQTTYRNTSPSAETVTNATAETTVTNVNATANTTVTNTNAPAETTVRNATATTTETTVTTANATVGPGCSDPPILCCAGQNNGCFRKTCYCDQACVNFRDCCSDFNSTCMNYFQSMTLHLKVSLLTQGSNNNNGTRQALLTYLSNTLLQSTCKNCSLSIKHIVFNYMKPK
ncbi:uncharacterized protein LOC129362152 isoform X2 [Poeciliopsis prolifica]|uniref:uncharacterized protein LOC129362152 isoform X2 n=1 Tax=Poeciliopsis prolifica TaxID=188132 RepID=UPI00241315AB|nr:uncharacterized protein LOC129362152 isoform X2 [Poeciliopsis prolifica]